MKFGTFSRLILAVLLLTGLWTYAAAEDYSALRADYQQLVKSAQLQRQRANWERLIDRFQGYVAANPYSGDRHKAQFLLARTWDGLARASGSRADARQSVEHYLLMADRFPDSRLTDDALFLAGQITENQLADEAAAYALYKRLVEQLPSGDMAGEALKRLAVLPAPTPPVEPEVAEEPEPEPEIEIETYVDEHVGEAPQLERVRYWSGPEYTRVVLDLTAPVVANPHYLKGESPRLYFDLLYTEPAKDLPGEIPIRNGLILQVRTSRFDEQRTRVVLDLNRVAEYKLTTLENPHRLVVDIKGAPLISGLSSAGNKTDRGAVVAEDDSIASILGSSADRQTVIHVPQNKKDEGIRLIVVDAGHGGKDPGAIGPNNVYEKDVTLRMAQSPGRRTASEARRQGIAHPRRRHLPRVAGTDRFCQPGRSGPVYLAARQRDQGRQGLRRGKLFPQSFQKQPGCGSRRAGKTEPRCRRSANLEAILFDLMANAKINESSRLAAEVQQAMVAGLKPHYSRIKDLGVKQGPFHVLLGATMPSVLIEAAFISNRREEKRLTSSAYHKHVAAAIVKWREALFEKHRSSG